MTPATVAMTRCASWPPSGGIVKDTQSDFSFCPAGAIETSPIGRTSDELPSNTLTSNAAYGPPPGGLRQPMRQRGAYQELAIPSQLDDFDDGDITHEPPEETMIEQPLPEMVLNSRMACRPNFGIASYVIVSISMTSFTIYYAWNASVRFYPSKRFMFTDPDHTIFMVNLLSYFSTVLVKVLIDITCDQVRWSKCNTKSSLSFLSFLALSSATGVAGLTHLLLSPFPRLTSKGHLQHRLWSLQRYSLA